MKIQLKPLVIIGMVTIFMLVYLTVQPVFAYESQDKLELKIIIHATAVDKDENDKAKAPPMIDDKVEDPENLEGSIPKTGGISPIIFYGIGGILVIGGLVLKRKDFF